MEWLDAIVESFGWVHFWIALGVLLGVVEIITVSFLALPFALGALITAIFAWFDLPLTGQWLIFAVSSLIMLFVIQKSIKRFLTSKEGESVKTNVSALVGRQALVLEPIRGQVVKGSVKVGGEIWSAVSEGDEAIEADSIVIVSSVEGAKLVVRPESGEEQPVED